MVIRGSPSLPNVAHTAMENALGARGSPSSPKKHRRVRGLYDDSLSLAEYWSFCLARWRGRKRKLLRRSR